MKLKVPIRAGLGFGITTAVITTLGLMIGLQAGTNSRLAVIGGILMIAVADAFADGMGMHISESARRSSERNTWIATLATFTTKFIFGITFTIPVIFLPMFTAIIVDIVWGLLLLGIFSYYVAVERKEKPIRVISEHISIAILVIVITHYFGLLIAHVFG